MVEFMALMVASTLIMCHSNHGCFDYQTHKPENRGHIIDAHFQDGSMSVSLSFLPIKPNNSITLEGCDYAAVC